MTRTNGIHAAVAELLTAIHDAEVGELGAHDSPGRVAAKCPDVPQDLLARINPQDCGWVIPVAVGLDLQDQAVLMFHPSNRMWETYSGADIPMWVAVQMLHGTAAIEYAEANSGEVAICKYADPVEDAREGLTEGEARKVAAEDPTLIHLLAW